MEQLQQPTQPTQPLQTYKIEATESDMMAIDVLFSSMIPHGMDNAIKQKDIQEQTQLTINGLFGAANGIMRSALLLKYIAGNKPEIFISLLAIADAISTVGENLANKSELDQNSQLDMEELQPIIDIISQIHIDLPEELQAFKDSQNPTNSQKNNDESN